VQDILELELNNSTITQISSTLPDASYHVSTSNCIFGFLRVKHPGSSSGSDTGFIEATPDSQYMFEADLEIGISDDFTSNDEGVPANHGRA